MSGTVEGIKENQDSTPKFTFFSSMHGMLPRKLRKLKSFLTIVDETKSKEQEGNDQIHKSTNPLSNTVLKITGSKKKSKEESESILRQVKMKTQHTETYGMWQEQFLRKKFTVINAYTKKELKSEII